MAKKGEALDFKIGDIVAAKVKGHPTWPAKIEKIIAKGKYEVRFFHTFDTASKFICLKPFNEFSETELKCKRKGFQEALKECREEIETSVETPLSSSVSPPSLDLAISSQDESPERLLIDDSQQIEATTLATATKVRKKRGQVDRSQEQRKLCAPLSPSEPSIETVKHVKDFSLVSNLNDTPNDVEEDVRPPVKRRKIMKTRGSDILIKLDEKSDQDHSKRISIKIGLVDKGKLDIKIARIANSTADPELIDEQQAKVLNGDDTSVDCSLNDLTSEQTNTAERGLRKSISKSDIIHETLKQSAIKKLQQKLQKKLEEKALKKKDRAKHKQYEKASKIFAKFESLTEASKNFKSGNKKDEIKLMTSMDNCEKRLDLLKKCLEFLLRDYGWHQRETRQIHDSLTNMVNQLKEVRNSGVGVISKGAKKFLKQMKAFEPIKKFINHQPYEEPTGERKENAKKRANMSR